MEIEDSPGNPNTSQASRSAITTSNTDDVNEQQIRKKFQELSNTLGITQLREDSDAIKETLKLLLQKQEEIIVIINKHDQVLKTAPSSGENSQLDQLERLGSLVEKLDPVLDRIWPKKTEGGSGIISQQYIDDHIKKSVMGNFEVGEALIDTLKNKIVGKAMTKAVSEIVTDTHEPG